MTAEQTSSEGGEGLRTCPNCDYVYVDTARRERDEARGLRRMLAESTPGPWKKADGAIYGATENGRHSLVSADLRGPNAALVLAAVNALPDLLAERDALADGCTHLENEFGRLTSALDTARREADDLRAQLGAVEALAEGLMGEEYWPYAVTIGGDVHLAVLLDDLRAALANPPAVQREEEG